MRRERKITFALLGAITLILLPCFPYNVYAQIPFLSSPIDGYTPYTILISSVFDHSMTRPYKDPDNIVIAYTGEKGYRNPSDDCFAQQRDEPFVVNGNYVGTSGTGGRIRLCYDGHPGFDFPFRTGTPVLAAATGKVKAFKNDCSPGDLTCS